MNKVTECKRIRSLFTEDTLGALDRDESLALRKHLASCPACLASRADFEKTIALCRQLPSLEVPEELHRRIMRGIVRYRETSSFYMRVVMVTGPRPGERARPSRTAPADAWTPPADLHGEKDKFVLRVLLPGVPRPGVKLTASPFDVTVTGVVPGEHRTAGAFHHHREIPVGVFFRSLELPRPIIPEKTTASLKNGVLTVILSKKEKDDRVFRIT